MSDSDFAEESSSKSTIKRKRPPLNGGEYSGGGSKTKKNKINEMKVGSEIGGSLLDEPIDRPMASQIRISPSQMITIVQNLNEFVHDKSCQRRRFLTFTDYDAIGLPNGLTSKMVRTDIKRYVKEAASLSSLSLKTAIDLLSSFLADGSSITMDAEFPKRPPSAFNLFIRNSGTPGADAREAMMNHAAHWKSESYVMEKEAAEKEALELQKTYLKQLIEYRDKHKEITEAHAAFTDKLIASTRKLVSRAEGTEIKSPKKLKQGGPKKGSRAPKTPFELFCMSKADKYADLDPERRERKLRKKFDKLGEAEREIYNNLAAAL